MDRAALKLCCTLILVITMTTAGSPRAAIAAGDPLAARLWRASRAGAGKLTARVKARTLDLAEAGARRIGGVADRTSGHLSDRANRLEQGGRVRWMHRPVRATARLLSLCAGTETLLQSSVEAGGGFGVASPLLTRAVNINTGVGLWSGSIKYHRTGVKDVVFNKGVSMETPFGSVNKTSLGRWGGSFYALPFLSGYKDGRSHGIFLGNEGIFEIGLGEVGPGKNKQGQPVLGRGPFLEVTLAIPFLPLGLVNGFGGVSFAMYSPALGPLTRFMERPAGWVHRRAKHYNQLSTRGWGWIKEKLGRGESPGPNQQ